LPYIIDFINSKKLNSSSIEIKTTIDYNLTNEIDSIARKSITPIMWKDVWDYSIIITDRKTNKLKVMIW